MPRFIVRDAPFSIFVNGANGVANNALSCANSASLNPTAAATIEAWLTPVGDRKTFVIFDNSESGVTTAYFVLVNANGSISSFSTIGGVSRNIAGTSLRVRWNEPNFFQWTYTGSAVNMFLNGSQFTEQITGISGALGTNTGRMRMGSYFSGGSGLTMLGFLYKPRVYSVGCTLAEHQARYYSDQTSAALQAGLVLNPDFSTGSGGTITDLSGFGNTITIGASTSWNSINRPFANRTAASGRVEASGRVAASGRVVIT